MYKNKGKPLPYLGKRWVSASFSIGIITVVVLFFLYLFLYAL